MNTSNLSAEDKMKLNGMYAELKKTLKQCSKNDLIRMVGEALVDNYILQTRLEAATKKEEPNV